MKKSEALTVEEVRDVLDYCKDTGLFHWKKRNGRRIRVGSPAGSIDGWGYVQICINKRGYKAHRLAWLYVHGTWPKNQIDHINNDPSDNRLKNLREATQAQNMANRSVGINNTSGFKGVQRLWYSRQWRASIRAHGATYNLGLFDTPELAHEAYFEAAKRFFGEFARPA